MASAFTALRSGTGRVQWCPAATSRPLRVSPDAHSELTSPLHLQFRIIRHPSAVRQGSDRDLLIRQTRHGSFVPDLWARRFYSSVPLSLSH